MWFVIGLVLLMVMAWVWITQPVLPRMNADDTSATVDPARLKTHVRMLSETLSPRDARHPENLDRVADYVQQEFEQAGGVVREQPYEVNGNVYRNVMTLFGPETTERIVVGAHYDAVGNSPAADDNASGVAGLIELAHLLGQTSLPMRVELVAYTLEEPPYFRTSGMGSAVHAWSLKEQGVSVRAMLALEMIGYFSDAPNSQHFPISFFSLFYPSQGNFIAIVGKLEQGLLVRRIKKVMRNATSLPVYSINAPGFVPGVDFSDHLNYWQAGYQAAMITDTAFYRNMNYHSLYDTPDTLDYERMALVVQGVYAAVLAEAT
jgi:Zn-dependent M28 family amino/carboxypeptidase